MKQTFGLHVAGCLLQDTAQNASFSVTPLRTLVMTSEVRGSNRNPGPRNKAGQLGWLLKLNSGVGSLWRGDNMESTKKGRPTVCEQMVAETFC